MGHDAIADLQHHVERAVRRLGVGQPGQRTGDLDAAFQPPADLEKTPAGETVHVLVQQAGEAGKLAQDDGHCPCRVIARRHRRRELVDGLRQVLERQPAIGREAVADLPGAIDGAVQRAD